MKSIDFFLCTLYKNVQNFFCMSLKNFANCKKNTAYNYKYKYENALLDYYIVGKFDNTILEWFVSYVPEYLAKVDIDDAPFICLRKYHSKQFQTKKTTRSKFPLKNSIELFYPIYARYHTLKIKILQVTSCVVGK